VENQGNPRVKKSKKNLKVFLTDLSKSFEFDSKIETVANNSLADVNLSVSDDVVTLNSSLIAPNQKSSLSPKNLSTFLSLLENKKKFSQHSMGRASLNLIKGRPIVNYSKKLDFSLSRLLKKKPNQSLKECHLALKDDSKLNDLHSDSLSTQSFLSSLFDLSFFVNFTTIQLLLHEKGKNEAETHIVFKSGEYRKNTIAVNSFAQAFQSIKKSKTKFFNNSQSQQSIFEVLGPFLAKEFELHDHSSVLIISRDGFLPVTDEDHHYLNSISPSLKSILLSMIVKTKFSDRQRTLLCSLNFFPEPIVAKVSGNVVFKNKSYLNSSFDRSMTPKIYNIGAEINLLVWQIEMEDTTTDLGHFQRISLLGELLNTLKHELSNPLFGLSLSSELLLANTSDTESKDFLRSITDSTKRCNEIIMNFSSFYLDSQSNITTPLNKIIMEVFTLSKSETRGISKSLKFLDDLDDTLEIKTNPTLVSQILFNLVVNSAQAIAEKVKNPSISVTVASSSENLIISVCDNGPELPEHELDKIFKPFYTTKLNGTGLGLSICRKLAKRLGGDLRHSTNKPFPGLTFSLVLPY
jgi:two-component system, NtrC family, sensor kinase